MARRVRGEGSVSRKKRADGRYRAYLWVTDPDGRKVRRDVYGYSPKEASDKLAKLRTIAAAGLPVAGERLKVDKFLIEWLASTRPSLRPSTYRRYEGIVRLHLVPGLGHRPLVRLAPADVQRFLAGRSDAGCAPRTVWHIRAVLRAALGDAMRLGLVGRNAAALAEAPRIPYQEVEPMPAEEARAFLAATAEDRLGPLYAVALGTGLRQGELLALRWADVDLDAANLRVGHSLIFDGGYRLAEPKSGTSRRMVDLPSFVVAALRRQRVHQAEERLLAGAEWREEIPDLVFRTTLGRPMNGREVTRWFQGRLAELGLPRRTFHSARHSTASLLLAAGADLRTIQAILGHSSITLTANTYAHLLASVRRDAADRLDALLGVGS